MKYIVVYEPAEDVGLKVAAYFPDHAGHFAEFHSRGDLLMIGAFTDPSQGAMAIFANRPAAENFAATDPFVRHGVVGRCYIKEWNAVLVA